MFIKTIFFIQISRRNDQFIKKFVIRQLLKEMCLFNQPIIFYDVLTKNNKFDEVETLINTNVSLIPEVIVDKIYTTIQKCCFPNAFYFLN